MFESMFQPRTPSSKPSASIPEKTKRAPKGHKTINGKVYREATGYVPDRCPGSGVRIPLYIIRRTLGSAEYRCPKCGGIVKGEWQNTIREGWSYETHNRAEAPAEYGTARTLPEEPEF